MMLQPQELPMHQSTPVSGIECFGHCCNEGLIMQKMAELIALRSLMKVRVLENISSEGSISLREPSQKTGAQKSLLGSFDPTLITRQVKNYSGDVTGKPLVSHRDTSCLVTRHLLTAHRANAAHGHRHRLPMSDRERRVRTHSILTSVSIYARDSLPANVRLTHHPLPTIL